MYLPCIPIPPIGQYTVTGRGFDRPRILHRLPGQLGKCFPNHQRPSFFLSEAILLAVAGIPDPVDKQVGDVKERQGDGVPMVNARCVVGEVDG